MATGNWIEAAQPRLSPVTYNFSRQSKGGQLPYKSARAMRGRSSIKAK